MRSLHLISVAIAMFGLTSANAATDAYSDGVAAYNAGQYEQAAKFLTEATAAHHSNDPLAHYYLGNTLLRLQRQTEAVDEFRTALELKPSKQIADYCRAMVLIRYGTKTGAIGAKLGRFGEILAVGVNTPASRAGLQVGDKIDSIDGKAYAAYADPISAIRGSTGVPVKLVIERDHRLLPEFTIVRAVLSESVFELRRIQHEGAHVQSSNYPPLSK